jgi:hypothetical protein
MRRILIATLLLGSTLLDFSVAGLEAQSDASDVISLRCKLRARNPDQVKEELTALAAANKGYLLKLSARRIEIYLARSITAPAMIDRIASYGQLVERSVGRQDVSTRMRDLETAIRVREDHLNKLQKMVEGSNAEQTLQLEKEVNRVISSIEENRGRLNYYRERVALMHVAVEFTHSSAPSGDTGIPIDWVRNLNIEDFLDRF